jgi:putative exporter of polyketide antibiotics
LLNKRLPPKTASSPHRLALNLPRLNVMRKNLSLLLLGFVIGILLGSFSAHGDQNSAAEIHNIYQYIQTLTNGGY